MRRIADQGNRKPTQKGNLTSNDEGKAHLAGKSKLNSRDLGKSSPVDTEKRSPINQRVSILGDKAQVKSVRYKFWYEDDRPVPVAININNWALVLREERQKEVLNIWMRKDVPSITVQSPMDHRSDGQLSFGRSERGLSSVPPVTKPFLAWPIVDEFGELDPLDLDDRCQRFLRAFHLDLPVPIVMSKEERARRPKQASAQRVAANATVLIAGKALAEVRNEIEANGNNAFAIEIFDKFKELLRLFLPDPYGINSESDPIRLYWGSVCVITVRLLLEFPENKLTMPVAQAAGRSATKNSSFRGFSANLSSIIADAVHLHRGVHCSESKQVPRPEEWREADTIAEGAVLLSAIVEALGAIFRILVESVRSIRVIRPAATSDLEKLLGRYRKNHYDYQRNTEEQRKARVLLKPIMLTAFGCLSHGLSHIHGRRIRHKDIKPANILYERELSKDRPARFLWADFGLAYHFGATGSSKTRGLSQYSRRYAAPERMEASQAALDAKAAGLAGVHTNQDTDEESEAFLEPETDCSETKFANGRSETRPANGRSSDIFSFGCVFLEILSTMTDAKIPNAESDSYEFWRNVTKLQAWAESQNDQLEPNSPLRVPFALAIKMIRYKARKRPSIDKIVESLAAAAAAKEYFCASCLQEVEKVRLEREKDRTLLGLDRYKYDTESSENTESGSSDFDAYERPASHPGPSNGVNGHNHPPARMPATAPQLVPRGSQVGRTASKSSISEAPVRLNPRTI